MDVVDMNEWVPDYLVEEAPLKLQQPQCPSQQSTTYFCLLLSAPLFTLNL